MKKSIVALIMASSLACVTPVVGEILYGYYTWSNITTGIEAWAYNESGYRGARVRIQEGSYDSGWKTGWNGTHVSASKTNNPLKTCYKYHSYIQ